MTQRQVSVVVRLQRLLPMHLVLYQVRRLTALGLARRPKRKWLSRRQRTVSITQLTRTTTMKTVTTMKMQAMLRP